MFGNGFGIVRSPRRARGAGVPVSPLLPQPAFIVARWSPDEMPVQADNSNVTSFTDSVSGIAAVQATPANQPKYRTGGQNGKPYIQYSGNQELNAGQPGVITAPLLAGTGTVMVFFRNPLATTAGSLFTASNSTGLNLYATGSAAGLFGNAGQRVPYASAAFSSVAYVQKKPDTSNGRVFINGGCINSSGVNIPAAGHDIRLGGALTNTLLCYKGEAYDVIVWNIRLTPAEVMQAHKWACSKYAVSYPWAGNRFHIFHGDSITNGLGATLPLDSYPAKVAALMGLQFGQWSNLGHTGAHYDSSPSGFNLSTEALEDVDPIPAAIAEASGFTLSNFEWFNQRNASTPQARAAAYMAARKAANPNLKIIFGTSTDATDASDNAAARAAYNSYWETPANRTGLMDGYVPIHIDSLIGVEGACPNSSPYGTYFHTDGIHLSTAGYTQLATLWQPVLAGV